MIWSVNVNTKNESLQVTAQQHAENVQKVLTFLKGLKIDEDKLQTSRMQFGENWKTVNREHVKVGYYASTDITFTISDFDLYQKIWFGLAEIKEVSIQSTRYAHSDRIKYQDESRLKAAQAAKEKAQALANTLGRKISFALKIEETAAPQIYNANFLSNSISNDMESFREGGSGATLALGQLTISTSVKVTFKLVN